MSSELDFSEASVFKKILILGTTALLTIATVIGIFFSIGYVHVKYTLWKVEYTGKALEIEKLYKGRAILAEAQNARQATVEAAKAELEAASHIAASIEILGQKAKDFPEYREQIFIQAFADAVGSGTINSVHYIATEGGVPILTRQIKNPASRQSPQ